MICVERLKKISLDYDDNKNEDTFGDDDYDEDDDGGGGGGKH